MQRRYIREVGHDDASARKSPGKSGGRSGANDTYRKKFPKRKLRIEAFFAFVFFLVILYIIGYFYTSARRPEISQMRLEMGVIAQPAAFNGVIIRDEAVYYATDAGS
ncbi:MAG: hypothetical protein LBE55_06625, partial [Clostridiales bacterium]|nr:hypothetical protein [Clostridiales bacterium]